MWYSWGPQIDHPTFNLIRVPVFSSALQLQHGFLLLKNKTRVRDQAHDL